MTQMVEVVSAGNKDMAGLGDEEVPRVLFVTYRGECQIDVVFISHLVTFKSDTTVLFLSVNIYSMPEIVFFVAV